MLKSRYQNNAFVFLVIVCSLLLGHSSFAARSCDQVDLNAAPDSPLRKMPVYDQDGAGLCYAYAAAQLFNFEKIKAGKEQDQVSPISAAETDAFQNVWSDSNVMGGDPFRVLMSLNKNGYCTVQETERLLGTFKQGKNPLTDAQIALLFAEYAKMADEKDLTAKKAFRRASAYFECSSKSMTKISEYMVGKSTQRELFRSIFDQCPKKETAFMDFNVFGGSFGDSEYLDHIDEALASGRPISIDYCAELQFSKKKHASKSPDQALADGECGLHASIVTGQRKAKTGECQIMIRNSWGPDWRGPKGTPCACITESGEYQQTCQNYSKAREVVGCWFERDGLLKNMRGGVYRVEGRNFGED